MMRLIIVVLVVLITTSLQAQNTDTIYFQKNYISINNESSTLPVYKYKGDTIYYRSKPYEINIPNELDITDLGFCFIYFIGWENSQISKISPLLISGITDSVSNIYVDLNQNLDFTDDGIPLLLNGLDDSVIISLNNSENPIALFNVSLKFARYNDKETENRVVSFFRNHKNGRRNELIDNKYWLSSTRLNFLITEGKLQGGSDSIKIGIQDYNCNGLFCDKRDRVLIGNYNTGFISDLKSKGSYNYEDTTVVKINNAFYEVTDIEESGNYICLKSTNLRSDRMEVGDEISDISVSLIDGSSMQLYDLLDSEKYNLINIWGTWCAGCILQTDDLLRLDSLYSSELNIIAFNYGDSKKNIKSYLLKNNIPWVNGLASKEMRNIFLVDSYPYLLLLDKNNMVISIQTNINEVERILATD